MFGAKESHWMKTCGTQGTDQKMLSTMRDSGIGATRPGNITTEKSGDQGERWGT